jgi:AcrR family transcriptional regulator
MNARPLRAPSRRGPATKSATSTSVGGAPAQERKLRTQGKKTLRKLLDAAMIVFEKRGYHAARVDDIVKVAKTSHGTFYLYFANKEDLFRALLADVSDEMTQLSEQLPSIAPTKAGYDELRAWIGQFFDLYGRYYPVIRAWTESEVGESDLGELGVNVLGGFANALTARVAEVDPPVVANPNIAAVAMVAMVERFSYYVLSRSLDVDRDELLDTLTGILHVGLFAGARRRPTR